MKLNKKSVVKEIFQHWQLYLLLLPAVAYIILFAYKPMYGILIAFKDFSIKKGVWDSPWVGFDNFQRVFSSYWFPVILKNTLVISLVSLLLGFPFPIILALFANELKNMKVKKVFQTISYAPHFISTVVVCGMLTLMLSPSTGVVNLIITALGGEPVSFLQDAGLFKWVFALSGVWQGAGWGAIIYFAALSGVDPSLIEAARIDGANRVQTMWHINLPTIRPTIVVMFILRCGSLLSVGYEKVYLLQTSTNLSGSEVISTYVYKMGLENNDFGFSTAIGLFNSVVNCIILLLVNTLSKKIGDEGSSLF